VVAVKFLRLLLTVLFIAMGVLELLLTLVYAYGAPALTLETILTIMLSIGFIIAGYGLYTGAKWGLILAVLFTILNIVGSYVLGNTYALVLYIAILAMLLLSAKQQAKPPTALAPGAPPATIAASIFINEKEEGKFVKRKY
jgi:hypothetical protein